MIVHENDFLEPYGVKVHGVIEVGAHYAEEYAGMAGGGIENFMFFEPIPDNYKKMVSRLPTSGKIKTYNMALGNFTGRVPMWVETAHQGKSCSILTPHLHKEEYPDIIFNGQEVVDLYRLDDIEFDRNDYNMLQTDAQGYDLEVLKGAVDTLDHIDFIKVEVHRKELYLDAATAEQIDDFLVTWKRIYTYWTGPWGDAYYIKKK